MSSFLRTSMLAGLIAVTGASPALALGAGPREAITKPYAEEDTDVQEGRSTTTTTAPTREEHYRMRRSDDCDSAIFRMFHRDECDYGR